MKNSNTTLGQIILQGITTQELAEALAPLLQIQNTPTPPPDLIGRKDASKLLGINLTSLWKFTKSGKLKSYKIGARTLYKRSEILESIGA
jgi:hypothetical protein